jgi:hypothetical protein
MEKKHFPDDPNGLRLPKGSRRAKSRQRLTAGGRNISAALVCPNGVAYARPCDDITWTREIATMMLRGGDGYQ